MTPTEKLEANLEKRLAKEYRKARAELTKELNTTLKEFKEKDAWYKDQLGQGKIHQDTYKEWREAQLQHSQWVRDMRDQIAVDLYHVNRVATDMINGASPYAFCESVNYETYKLEHDMKVDTSFTLYSKSTLGALLKEHPSIMPRKVNKKKDTRWNRQNVTSALAQAVLQGDDTKQLAKRLMNVVDMNETSAMLASRTIMNSASNAGKQESIDRAIEAGIPVEKGWLATLDQRTRHSHRHMDMEFVKGNEKFSNGMMFPCDWSADIDNIGAEIYNCRCQMITRIAGIPFDMSGRNEKLGDMSYEEWKESKKPKANKKSDLMTLHDLGPKPKRPKASDYGGYTEEYYKAKDEFMAEKDAWEKRRDAWVKQQLDIEPMSTEDFYKWCNKQEITVLDDMSPVDGRMLAAYTKRMDKLFKDFPEVKWYRKLIPFEENGYKLTEEERKYLHYQVGVNLNATWEAEATHGFIFGGDSDDYEFGLKLQADVVSDGWNVIGDGTRNHLFDHEFGHNVKDWMTYRNGGMTARQRVDFEDEILALQRKRGASEYATTNVEETFAEAFAAWYGGEDTEFAREFEKLLRRHKVL